MTKRISNKQSTAQVSKKLFALPAAFAALGFFGCKDDENPGDVENCQSYYFDSATGEYDFTRCDKCQSGYLLSNNQCFLQVADGEVEFCQSYYFNNTISEFDYATCADCESGYQLFKNECFLEGLCVAGNCTACTATNTTQCEVEEKYHKDKRKETKFQNILVYRAQEIIFSRQNFIVSSTHSILYQVCDQGYDFDYFGECEGQCLNDSRCSDCNSDYTACNACRAPYKLDENGVCSICDVERCTECGGRDNPFGCVNCEDGYFVQLNFREPNSCEACTLSNCLECRDNSSGMACRTCADGFHVGDGVCVPDVQCEYGYVLENGVCIIDTSLYPGCVEFKSATSIAPALPSPDSDAVPVELPVCVRCDAQYLIFNGSCISNHDGFWDGCLELEASDGRYVGKGSKKTNWASKIVG